MINKSKPMSERLEFVIYKRKLANLLIGMGFPITRIAVSAQSKIAPHAIFMFKNTESIRDAYSTVCSKYHLNRISSNSNDKDSEIPDTLFSVKSIAYCNELIKMGYKVEYLYENVEEPTKTIFTFKKDGNIKADYFVAKKAVIDSRENSPKK